jgi:biotin operon repressor
MSASVRRLRTGSRAASAVAQLRLALDGIDGLPDDLATRFETLLDRHARSESGWSFVMVEPNLYSAVVDRLIDSSRRPKLAVRLWALLFTKLPPDSNDVQASREELARRLGCTPDNVSEMMGELEDLGAVYRRKEGRGVRYLVHPKFGTHLKGAIRDKAQAEAPPLRLVEPA